MIAGATHSGSTKVHSQQTFALGQTDVTGNPEYFSRTVVTSVAGAGNFTIKTQQLEDVSKTAGKTVTVTFWAKADASKNIAVELFQIFGTGGSPSSSVFVPSQTVSLTTSWAKHSLTFDVPSVSGKTRGTDENDYLALQFWFDAGSSFNSRTNTLGQQSGTFDMTRVSLCEGDATALDDPFEERTYGEELALCERYFTTATVHAQSPSVGFMIVPWYTTNTMRVTPTLTVVTAGTASSCSATVDNITNNRGGFLQIEATLANGQLVGRVYSLDAEL